MKKAKEENNTSLRNGIRHERLRYTDIAYYLPR